MSLGAVLACSSALVASSAAAAPEPPSVTLVVDGARGARGYVSCLLFRSATGFPTQTQAAWRRARTKVRGKRTEVRFASVPPGTYAASCIHDVNANGQLEKNAIGIPKEPWAVSNNVSGGIFGPPRFSQAKFAHRLATKQELRLND